MFSFLFKGTTYFLLWKKFKDQILLITVSFILIILISSIYDDLYKVLKVGNKESLFALLLAKWFLISSIVGFNIYKLRQVKLDKSEKNKIYEEELEKRYPKKSKEILKKEEKLTTRTDLILKKYLK